MAIEPDEIKQSFRRTEKLYQSPGQHVIRILDAILKRITVHTVRRDGKFPTVKCLGSDCPICESNRRIFTEHPDDYQKVEGYCSRSKRHYANVLDRTPVKICPNSECQAEVKAEDTVNFSANCPFCKTLLVSVPVIISNKVKVLDVSDEVAHQMDLLEKTRLDAERNVVGWTNYDFVILKQKGKSPLFQLGDNREPVSVPDEAKFDLDKAVIELTAEELSGFMAGAALKDLFAARRGTSQQVVATSEAKLTAEEIQKAISEIITD
jgi:hypothetical protein